MKLKTSRRWLLKAGVAVGTSVAALVPALAVSGAGVLGQHPEWNVGGAVVIGPSYLPDSFYETFKDCPDITEFPPLYPALLDEDGNHVFDEDGFLVRDPSQPPIQEHARPDTCVTLTAYDGELKLGDTVASVDPITVSLGVSPAGFIVMGGAAGDSGTTAAAPVRIPGGILGIAELDPLLALDSLGLLTLSATPEIGAAGIAQDGLPASSSGPNFFAWLASASSAMEFKLNIPLGIKLNNLLLGPNCKIPEFNIALTNGTTAPPEGVEPLTGTHGDQRKSNYGLKSGFSGYNTNGTNGGRVGAQFNDNTFAVPGAKQCDLLLGGLLNQPRGLFDALVDTVAGLPSPAGNNYAKFKLDIMMGNYNRGLIDARVVETEPLSFGSVPVGSTVTKTLTIRNNGGLAYRPVPNDTVNGSWFSTNQSEWAVVNNQCEGVTLANRGDTCTMDIAFTPTATGSKNSLVRVSSKGHEGSVTLPDPANTFPANGVAVTGSGVAAAPAAAQVSSAPAPSGGTSVTAAAPAKKCINLLFGLKLCF